MTPTTARRLFGLVEPIAGVAYSEDEPAAPAYTILDRTFSRWWTMGGRPPTHLRAHRPLNAPGLVQGLGWPSSQFTI